MNGIQLNAPTAVGTLAGSAVIIGGLYGGKRLLEFSTSGDRPIMKPLALGIGFGSVAVGTVAFARYIGHPTEFGIQGLGGATRGLAIVCAATSALMLGNAVVNAIRGTD